MTNLGTSPIPPELARMPEGGEVGPIQSGWRLAAREFAQNKLAVVGLVVLVFFIVFCYLGPFVYHGPLSSNLDATNLPPGAGHPLGTDNQGFDVLEELMIGGRAALEIGFLSAFIGMVWGAVWGAVSGLAGGLLDGFLMRIVDVLLSIPDLLAGNLICEAVFNFPGLGLLFYDSLGTADYPVLLAYTLVGAVLVVIGNFAADIALTVADPRIRLV